MLMILNESRVLHGLDLGGNHLGVSLVFNRLYSSHHLGHFTRESLRTILRARGLSVESKLVRNVPHLAIEVPVQQTIADAILRSAMRVLCAVNDVTRQSYLQTIVAFRLDLAIHELRSSDPAPSVWRSCNPQPFAPRAAEVGTGDYLDSACI
jgi:hypothetical protein